MNRAAIVATVVASTLAFSSPSLAASDEEITNLATKMSAAFKCATYAHLFKDQKEQRRLFQIGLKAGRELMEGMKGRNPQWMGETTADLPGVTTDFLIGSAYDSEAAKASGEIPLEQRYRPSEDNTPAKLRYRESNCSLIQ
jgi:hypothetical protein